MKKVLIWDTFKKSNTGGPSGYLYNLYEYLQGHRSTQISFLSDLLSEKYGDGDSWLQRKKPYLSGYKTIFGRLWLRLLAIYYICIRPYKKIEINIPTDIDVNEYDYVHIHQVTFFQQFKQLFPNYKGKIILTSHSPCPFSEELLETAINSSSPIRGLARLLRPSLLRQECSAYDMADYVMFPCFGAREPYEKYEIMRETFVRNERKFFYVPSAIVDYHPNIKTQQKISDFNIPSDAFVISFFGRHISIKGYDVLMKVGLELLNRYPNLYFLCGGNGTISPPHHQRWIELGFVNNVDDILPQVHLYVLPNKETYFDLITLQVLRAGIPLALSSTGGNKYFMELPKEETEGLFFFDINNLDALCVIIEDIMQMQKLHVEHYAQLQQANRRLFENHFTIDKYVGNYLEAINNLQ